MFQNSELYAMTKIIIIIFTLFAVISCSDEKDSAIENTKQRICEVLSQNPTPDGIHKAKTVWEKDFVQEYNLTADELPDYLVKLRKCFAGMNFKHEITPLNQALEGTVADYLKLKSENLQIILKNPEAPAFSINCTFTGIKKYTDSADFDIEGSLTLFDNTGKKLETYNVYPVPDFYLTMKKGSGDFKFTSYLDAIWYPYGKNPFDKAAAALNLMIKAKYYKIYLGIKGEKRKNGKEKMNDDEILDNLQILSAPSQ